MQLQRKVDEQVCFEQQPYEMQHACEIHWDYLQQCLLLTLRQVSAKSKTVVTLMSMEMVDKLIGKIIIARTKAGNCF